MLHEKGCAIAAQSQSALQLQRANSLFGSGVEIERNEPFAEWDMRIFKDCPDGRSELLVALAALMQSGANLFLGVGFNFPDGFRLVVFAMRTDRAVRPMD